MPSGTGRFFWTSSERFFAVSLMLKYLALSFATASADPGSAACAGTRSRPSPRIARAPWEDPKFMETMRRAQGNCCFVCGSKNHFASYHTIKKRRRGAQAGTRGMPRGVARARRAGS
eukprot:tig00000385_g24764.t1